MNYLSNLVLHVVICFEISGNALPDYFDDVRRGV